MVRIEKKMQLDVGSEPYLSQQKSPTHDYVCPYFYL